MTNEQHAKCMTMLRIAQRGNESDHIAQRARRELTDTVYQHYVRSIARLYTVDPIVDAEDLKHIFWTAVWKAIGTAREIAEQRANPEGPKIIADWRGNPIFHLAQRGMWAVMAYVTNTNSKRHGTPEPEGGYSILSFECDDCGEEPADLEADILSLVEERESQCEAEQRVKRWIKDAKLSTRQVEIIARALAGEFDLGEIGVGSRLASDYGVSGQRITQILQSLSSKCVGAETAVLA